MDRNERRAAIMDGVSPCQKAPKCGSRFGTGTEMRGVPYAVGELEGGTILAHCARLAWLFVWPIGIYYLERTHSGRKVVGRSSVLGFIALNGLRDAGIFLLHALLRVSVRPANSRTGGLSLANPPTPHGGA